MAFVNEYIPEADYERYDLRKVCGENNLAHRGHMYSRSWTINREINAFLIQVWSHPEADFSGWAFYWKGEWRIFEMRPVDSQLESKANTCWFRFYVKGLATSSKEEPIRSELLDDLRAAITASPGGMTWNYAHRSATVEFI